MRTRSSFISPLSWSFFTLLLASLATLAQSSKAGKSASSTGDSVLVIVEPTKQAEYSIFLHGLEKKGYAVTIRAPKADNPLLIEDGLPNFSHVVLLASDTKNFAQDISPQSLVQLLSLGTNLVLTLGLKQNMLTSLAPEFSLLLPPPATPLVSFFPERADSPSMIPIDVSRQSIPNDILSVFPSQVTGKVWFSGTAFALNSNPLLFPILHAPLESFAADLTDASGLVSDALADASEKGGEGLWAGSSLSVVAGFQTLVGGGTGHGADAGLGENDQARAVWVGGSSLFSDEFAKKQVVEKIQQERGMKVVENPSGNKQAALEIAGWAFQEKGVLRIDEVTHHKVNQTGLVEMYTTNDEIVYTTRISSFNPSTRKWEPYSGLKDLQLEFTMLDPHVRTALLPVKGKTGLFFSHFSSILSSSPPLLTGTYSTTFRAPDRHGVFKFVISYKRKGFTHLHHTLSVPVVPPRHDGYPRFLSAAWPYYAGAISTSIGFLIFCTIYVAGEAKEEKKSKKE
ncbi:Dolichyl-diphosphooligosaccharide-protein glycosyltransferase [Lentinula aciculospora]|uniref:Dolichyl-diphosphooligosaccharide--protein glycosyltransferase subunit WBP1 n=1 Tax=Lentinula aciculospora TaxID=153920 RepID=A0A9W9A6H2_9AGAR|nr:Dolichyl-diphosphooligosaccharide-protein glycosyltransferase [Lentinula aciculospora]